MDRAQLMAAMEAAAALKPHPIDIPAWGGTVYVRAITVAEVEDMKGKTNDKHHLARAAARVVCDSAGALVFDPDSEADVEFIARQPWPLLQRVLAEGDKANGIGADAAEQAGNG